MSRILLFSDSHGVAAAMKALRARVEADAYDLVCFLGDGGTLRVSSLLEVGQK